MPFSEPASLHDYKISSNSNELVSDEVLAIRATENHQFLKDIFEASLFKVLIGA